MVCESALIKFVTIPIFIVTFTAVAVAIVQFTRVLGASMNYPKKAIHSFFPFILFMPSYDYHDEVTTKCLYRFYWSMAIVIPGMSLLFFWKAKCGIG